MPEPLLQVLLSLAYYAGLLLLVRLAGKRLAGQTTVFDLIVLIGLGVALQQALLRPGPTNTAVFIATVFVAHRGLALACAKSRTLRRLIRGAPTPLVLQGRVDYQALEDEGLSYDELMAGLRKLGYGHPEEVRNATLEETGQISAVPK